MHSTVLTGSEDGSAKLINIASGYELLQITCENAHTHTHSSPSSLLLTNCRKILATLGGHADAVESVGFCAVSNLPFVSTCSLDHTAKIWDITTLQLRSTLQHDVRNRELLHFLVLLFSLSLSLSLSL
jgi:WD40 repeat protein